MSKKKPQKHQEPKKEEPVVQPLEEQGKGLSNKLLLGLTFLLAVVYFIFSSFSDGFYMHDEVSNFINAQNIWYDGFLDIVGANMKGGYRILYAIPSLGGFTFMKFFNSLTAAFTVYFSYKILEKIGSRHKLLIFFVLGLQPLWFMLSFRNYTELTVAFLLTLSVLQFVNKKYIWAALLISYVAFIRSEYHLISGLLFLVLLFRKEWIAALLTGTFTALQNLLGYIETGDILYLPHAMSSFSERIKDAWPKQGFDHYFLMATVIFGALAVTLFIAYIGIVVIKKKRPNWYLLVPALLIFLLNCAINSQSMDFGPGNGGNLRYLITISPLVGMIGVLAVDEISGFVKKYLLLVFLIPLMMAVGIYQTYEHNFIKFTEVEDWKPLIFTILTAVVLLLPLKAKHYTYLISALAIMVSVSTISVRKIQPEELTVKKAAKWYTKQLKQGQLFTEDNRIVCGHSLFFFYLEKNKNQFKKRPENLLMKEVTDTLSKGDLVIWESHYGYRPKLRPTSQPYEFYEKSPDFQKIQYYQSSDRRFTIVFFQKTN
ncbi:MAG: DUF2029 domain-containing protein [Flavobacteriales bacterium]|nr:DUF2029 domain-containing protein [Flavobacteriales bacterium]